MSDGSEIKSVAPSSAEINGFCALESIVWHHSSAQEKTRLDLLALTAREVTKQHARRS